MTRIDDGSIAAVGFMSRFLTHSGKGKPKQKQSDQRFLPLIPEFARQFKQQFKPAVPVILCTGYSDTVSPEKADALGIKALIYKPISKKEIAQKIREALSNRDC